MADKVTAGKSPDKPLMRDYWTIFRRRTYSIITSVQITFAFLLLITLDVLGIVRMGWVEIFVLTFIISGILNAITIALIHVIGGPFRDLVQAIVLVSGEPSAATPPNPNRYEYNNDGFKEIIQTVYEMGARETEAAKEQAPVDSPVIDGVEHMSTGLVIMDDHGKIIYHNERAPVRLGSHDLPVLDLLFPDDDTLDAWLAKNAKNKLAAERQWTRVADRLPGDKDRRIYDIAASYRKDSQAETVLVLIDRTGTYAPEEDDLDFISFAAHELRGPITVIRGYLDVLQEELSPHMADDQVELMRRLIVSSNRLTSYVNNILNASRYDRRHLKLHLAEESVRHMYDLIADDMQMRASAQNRLLIVDIPEDLPTVAADANSIGEVLGNLIDNAIKYSNEGGLVHVMARAVSGFVEISVIDRGIGMPANVLPNLFHKFYRSHRSRETVAGTGIGLYICKAIVSSHGGTITARSVENEGSTFSFTLPIYDTVEEKIKMNGNSNESLIEHGSGWIRNHSLYRG